MSYSAKNRAGRAGFSLVELAVSSIAAGVLMLGLASSLFLATAALEVGENSLANRASNARAVNQMLQNIRHAQSFSERTNTALTFTVPDRDGDDDPETLRYAWSGTAGDPVTYEYNGQAAQTVVADVQSIDFVYATRLMIAPVVVVSNAVPIVFEEFTEAKISTNGTSLSLNVPSGVADGDLLIAAVAHDGPLDGMSIAGWNEITVSDSDNQVCFGVWWKIAASEPVNYNCVWENNEKAYGWMMRFSGHDSTSPIHATAINVGVSATPTSPAVTTTVDDAMILRLGGFDDDDVTPDATGLAGNTAITMDESNDGNGSASGGAGYSYLATAGDSGTSTFNLTAIEEFVTVTLAITPAP